MLLQFITMHGIDLGEKVPSGTIVIIFQNYYEAILNSGSKISLFQSITCVRILALWLRGNKVSKKSIASTFVWITKPYPSTRIAAWVFPSPSPSTLTILHYWRIYLTSRLDYSAESKSLFCWLEICLKGIIALQNVSNNSKQGFPACKMAGSALYCALLVMRTALHVILCQASPN